MIESDGARYALAIAACPKDHMLIAWREGDGELQFAHKPMTELDDVMRRANLRFGNPDVDLGGPDLELSARLLLKHRHRLEGR